MSTKWGHILCGVAFEFNCRIGKTHFYVSGVDYIYIYRDRYVYIYILYTHIFDP